MICKINDLRRSELARIRRHAARSGVVFASNRQLLGSVDAHFDAPASAAEQGDLNGPVGEKLRHGGVGVYPVRGLNDDGFIGTAAEH
jgi:hypothetical protein